MRPCLVNKNSSASKEATGSRFLLFFIFWQLGDDSCGTIKFLLQGLSGLRRIGFFFCGEVKFLSIDEASVKPVLHVKEFRMCSFLDNYSTPENQNAIGAPNGGQSVCNHNCGAIFRDAVKGCLDYLLSTNVNCASGFIKNQNRRPLYDTSGYSQALSLTATQFSAILSHDGVVPLTWLVGQYPLGAQ
jgi:hypothetical protein